MSANEHRFRSAAFGFNRQDVIHYIEGVHKDHAAQIKSLKKELEQERNHRADAEEQGSLSSEAAAAADKDAKRAKGELTEALDQLREAQNEREELRLRLQALEKDFAELQEAADRMAPAARSYEALKEKAATIELDAHNRAQVIIKEGEQQAAETRREVREWLRQVESGYARLKTDVSATLSHAVYEMERTGRSLDRVTEELDGFGARFEDIAAGYMEEPETASAVGEETSKETSGEKTEAAEAKED